MAFTFTQSAANSNDVDSTTVTVALTGVTAGSLIVLWVKFEGDANNTATVSASDGTSSFTSRAVNHYTVGTDVHGVFLYLLSANSGSRTYTVTVSESVPFKIAHVREYAYTGTASFDVDDITAEGTSATEPTSGAVTTTGTDEVVIGGLATFGADDYTTPLIGGSAAGNALGVTSSAAYTVDRILTATMTTGTFTVTDTAGFNWVASIIAFKAVAAGGSPSPQAPPIRVVTGRRSNSRRAS